MSQITTHILDTSHGVPAQGVKVNLMQSIDGDWQQIATGSTNQDGRISDLLEPGTALNLGKYRLDFLLEDYFHSHQLPVFYPEANIVFLVSDTSHYHIPLLLSPYGYSTYRGS
jgi:5-hydroxyisourate hydrolase